MAELGEPGVRLDAGAGPKPISSRRPRSPRPQSSRTGGLRRLPPGSSPPAGAPRALKTCSDRKGRQPPRRPRPATRNTRYRNPFLANLLPSQPLSSNQKRFFFFIIIITIIFFFYAKPINCFLSLPAKPVQSASRKSQPGIHSI